MHYLIYKQKHFLNCQCTDVLACAAEIAFDIDAAFHAEVTFGADVPFGAVVSLPLISVLEMVINAISEMFGFSADFLLMVLLYVCFIM